MPTLEEVQEVLKEYTKIHHSYSRNVKTQLLY